MPCVVNELPETSRIEGSQVRRGISIAQLTGEFNTRASDATPSEPGTAEVMYEILQEISSE
jgi:hypothetical protein